ncbi:MAG: hypothetical protein K6E67_10510 [Prevotella sp.]|nr:hypothetical protein [Prevotella sp.]
MVDNQKNVDEGFELVQTKVPLHIKKLLDILAKQRGMSVYELLQLLINAFITASKANGPLSPQMKTLIEMLQTDTSWRGAFSFTGLSSSTDVEQAILIMRQRDQAGRAKPGFGIAMIDHPCCGGTTMTLCVDDILERVVEVSMKGLYRRLREIGVSHESRSIRETLTMLCDDKKIEDLNEQDRMELPGYGEYHEYGKRIEYGKKTKNVHHLTPDSHAKQQTIHFGDIDSETADNEVARWEGEHRQHEEPPADMESEMGFRPHGQDW